jgi:hypothetical protein
VVAVRDVLPSPSTLGESQSAVCPHALVALRPRGAAVSDNLIIVVRPGTKVRFVESAALPEGQGVLVIDADKIPVAKDPSPLALLIGLPVFNAERAT